MGLLVVLALAAVAMPRANAARNGRPGTLDPSFGHKGKVFAKAPPAGAHSEFGSVARQPDGNLLLESNREVPERPQGVREIERRKPDGSLDPSFGKGGKVRVSAGQGLALRADGSILVGTYSCHGERGSLILLNSRGAKDPAFGANGCGAPLPFGALFLSVAADGRVLLAGAASYCPPCGHDIIPRSETVIARLLPDGSLDPSFGKGGVVRTRADYGVEPTGSGEESLAPTGIAPTTDGGVAVSAGSLLLRLNAGGALEAGFGKGGVATVKGRSAGLFPLPDGRIVVASTVTESTFQEVGEIVVSRFRPDGTPDPSFGNGGEAQLPQPMEVVARAVAPAPGEGVFVAGELSAEKECRGECARKPILARFQASGQLDPGYGNSGIAALPQPPNSGLQSLDVAAIATSPDGAAVVTGGRYADDAFAIARASDGTPISEFGDGGMLIERHYLPPNLEVSGFALDPKGGFTVAAEGSAGSHEYGGFLLGFRSNGRQDRGSSGNGVDQTWARGEIQPGRGGRVVSWWEGMHFVMAVGRHGTAVKGYGKDGKVNLPSGFHPRAIDAGPKGSVTVVGTIGNQHAMGVYRLNAHGRPLAGFGRRGLAEVPFGRVSALAFAALVEPNGSVVVTGWVNGHVGATRLLPSGRLDRRFGKGGRVRGLLGEGAYGTRIAPLGGGVVIAATEEGAPNSMAGVVRLDRRGRLVRAFGHRGAIRPRTDSPPLALFAGSGRIVVVTDTEYSRHSSGGVELRAYRPDGSVDRRFGRGGLTRAGVGQPKYFHPVAAVQQSDDRIVVAGAAWNGENSQVELLRFR